MVSEELISNYHNKHKIVITFNKDTLESYTNHYFSKFPNRKVPPLKWLGKKRNGQIYSWNRMINCPNRITQNQWKQDFAEYTKYILEIQNIKPYMLDRCALVVKQFNGTLASSDSDNISVKASLDAFVKWNLLEEDNYKVLNPVILNTGYDKKNPRTEIIIYPINEGYTYEMVMDIINHDLKGGD